LGVGNGGAISLTAGCSITTTNLVSRSSTTSGNSSNGGAITLVANNGNISTDFLESFSTANSGSSGNGGAITLSATNGTITTGYLQSSTDSFSGSAAAVSGNGGAITVAAANGISTGNVFSYSGANPGNAGNGSAINLTSTNGNISTGNVFSYSGALNGNATNGGAITIAASNGSITTGDVDSQSFAASGTGIGGAITFSASSGITTGVINKFPNSFGAQPSQASYGTISLTANEINLTGGSNSVVSNSSILLAPATPTQNIAIAGSGDSGTNTLDLTTNDLAALQNGFSSIIIGRPDGSGAISVLNSVTFNDPVTIQAPVGTGAIAANGSITGLGDASITLIANSNITTSNITAIPGITLTSNSGAINTSAGTINSSSSSTNGGAIALSAAGNITTGSIDSSGLNLSGNITLTSTQGAIDTTLGDVDSRSTGGNGGAIAFSAARNITTASIDSSGSGVSGNISLTSTQGAIDTTAGEVDSRSTGGNGGAIAFSAARNITTGLIDSSGLNLSGNISLTSTQGAIDTTLGEVDSRSTGGNGGAIAFSADGNINTANLNSSSTAASGNGGDMTLKSNTGAITTGNLNSSGGTNGGNLRVEASTQITTGQINTSGATGKGGNMTLDPSGDIQVSSINAQGGTQGGTVDITTGRFFRATDTFSAANGLDASISTAGGNAGGNIIIRHGGSGLTPFRVGDATINGTAGAITSGNFAIASFKSFPFTTTQGNIQIISVNPSINPVDLSQPVENLVDSGANTPTLSEFLRSSSPLTIDSPIAQLEKSFTDSFTSYLGISNPPPTVSLEQAQAQLRKIEQATGVKPALIYAICVPANTPSPNAIKQTKSQATIPKQQPASFWEFNSFGLTSTQEPTLSQINSPDKANAQLELVLVTAEGQPIQRRVEGATCSKVFTEAKTFRSTITDPRNRRGYLAPAQQFYQWLITPIEKDLQAKQINNLTFIVDAGLRSIPLAAMHDGKGFIVERYSVGLMPSLSLSDTRYVDVRNFQVLGMGAAKFAEQNPLPAVPIELSLITSQLWSGKSFLDDAFTLENLKSARASLPFGIIHLATHAEFKPGTPSNSYIQLWNSKLTLDRLRQLKLYDPPVQLLVLSACRTALGDESAELGFTGLAVQAGVKSALGSLWYVSDEGTLGLMTTFYGQLKQAPIKAEALRRSQLAMLQGKVRVQQGKLVTSDRTFPLPPELAQQGDKELSHPYYWSAFTLIGNPW